MLLTLKYISKTVTLDFMTFHSTII